MCSVMVTITPIKIFSTHSFDFKNEKFQPLYVIFIKMKHEIWSCTAYGRYLFYITHIYKNAGSKRYFYVSCGY